MTFSEEKNGSGEKKKDDFPFIKSVFVRLSAFSFALTLI